MPHEVADVEPVLAMLNQQDKADFAVSVALLVFSTLEWSPKFLRGDCPQTIEFTKNRNDYPVLHFVL